MEAPMTVIHDDSYAVYSYVNNSTFMLSGPGSAMTFDGCMGNTGMIMGSNNLVSAGEGTKDTGLYDFGAGTQFSFHNLGKQAMTMADLKVYNFQSDLTGSINIETQFGQYAQTAPDGHGGTLLNISGAHGGQVDFINDPQANLNPHIHAGAVPFHG
jgi:hypothetical protein